MHPEFPLTITLEDGTNWQLTDEDEVACNLEWVNTDEKPLVRVVDARGRTVRLIVKACEIVFMDARD